MVNRETIEPGGTHFGQKLKFFLSRNFRFIPLFFGLLVFLIGLIFFLFAKFKDTKDMISQQQREQEQALTIYDGYLNKLDKLKESYAAVRTSELEKLAFFLPTAPEAEKLMMELEKIVSRNGLALSYIKVSEPASKAETGLAGGVKKIIIDLAVSGADYRTLKIFLSELENNLRLLDAQKISYSPSSETITLSLAAYYLPKH